VVGTAVGVGSYFDEGLRRSVIFWGQAFPIYLHYEFVHQFTKGEADHIIEREFDKLHDKYALVAKDLTLQLRGFYLKTAQLCSTIDGTGTVPPQYMAWCTQMQDEVPTPFAPGEARKLVEESLGKPIEEVFEWWDDDPCGSASIGQVHRARLRDGTEVAIKIQYPGIERKFRSDLSNIIRFCQLAMPQHVKPLREIEKAFMTEFDYQGEAKNLLDVSENLMKDWGDRVCVPKPVLSLCTKTVLTMEYLPGEPLLKALRRRLRSLAEAQGTTPEKLEQDFRDRLAGGEHDLVKLEDEASRMRWLIGLSKARELAVNTLKIAYNFTLGLFTRPFHVAWIEHPLNIAEIITLLLEVHGHEIFVDGVFNGDPHPGNVLLMPDGRLGLIDYGQVKRLPIEVRQTYAKLIIALSEDDKDEIVRLWLHEMDQRSKTDNKTIAYKLACFWHDRNTPDIVGDYNLHTFLESLEKEDPVVRVNEDYVMAARVSVLMRGFGNMMGLQLRVAPYWRPIAEQFLQTHPISTNNS